MTKIVEVGPEIVRVTQEPSGAGSLAGDSLAVGIWTLVSRITGFGKVVAIAAVLGPTYLGNTFQATNLLPNVAYEFLTGWLFSSLLVPPLVRHVDSRDRQAAQRLASGFLGVAMLGLGLLGAIAILAGPALLRLFALGVAEPTVAAAQRGVGLTLLALTMPQVVLYGIAGVGGAVANAHGRFALAAAAPAFENVGLIMTLGVTAALYGTGSDIETVTTTQLLVLGLGATGAVALHAAAQWWNARRAGISLTPRAGWRDPEVRAAVRAAVPSLGYSGLSSLRMFGSMIVANRVPGGVVAFQLALNFFHLPIALGARPVATAMLPRLARLHQGRAAQRFRDELVGNSALAAFLVVPAAVAYAVLAMPLARAAAFGEMANVTGIALVAAALAALAPGVIGESGFVLATHASYARGDARSPFRSMVVRAAVSLAGMAVAFALPRGIAVLVALGLALSASNLAGAWDLSRRVRAGLPSGGARLGPSLGRAFAASALMAVPAWVTAAYLAPRIGGPLNDALAIAAATGVGLCAFLAVQAACRSPELRLFRGGLRLGRMGGEA